MRLDETDAKEPLDTADAEKPEDAKDTAGAMVAKEP